MGKLPVIDLVFVILIFLMMAHGYVKGFIVKLFSWVALILSIFVAVAFYTQAAALIREKFEIFQNVRAIPEILGFIAIFIVVTLIVRMVEKVLKDVVNGIKLNGVNKVLGGAFGLLEGLALVALIIFVLNIQPWVDVSQILEESTFVELLLPLLLKIPRDTGFDYIEVALGTLPALGLPAFPG